MVFRIFFFLLRMFLLQSTRIPMRSPSTWPWSWQTVRSWSFLSDSLRMSMKPFSNHKVHIWGAWWFKNLKKQLLLWQTKVILFRHQCRSDFNMSLFQHAACFGNYVFIQCRQYCNITKTLTALIGYRFRFCSYLNWWCFIRHSFFLLRTLSCVMRPVKAF